MMDQGPLDTPTFKGASFASWADTRLLTDGAEAGPFQKLGGSRSKAALVTLGDTDCARGLDPSCETTQQMAFCSGTVPVPNA